MKANVWSARIMALVALGVPVGALILLNRGPADSTLLQALRRLGLWAIGATLLWGCLALVRWPRQLLARNAAGIGTRRPVVARICGCFGLCLGFLFLVGAAQGKDRFDGVLTIASLACAGAVCWWGLSQLKKSLDLG